MYIFDESKAVPLMASARVQRWALTLSAYTYSIQYKAGRDHANADGLSQLPLEDSPGKVPCPPEMVLFMDHLAAPPVSASHIRQQTNYELMFGQPLRTHLDLFKVVGKAQATKSNLHHFRYRCLVVALIDVSEVLSQTLHACMSYERKKNLKIV